MMMQLLNHGEKGDKTYQEVAPWLEMAYFGGLLGQLEVSAPLLDSKSAPSPPSVIAVDMPSIVVDKTHRP